MKRFLLKKKVDGPQTVVSVEYLESGVYVVKVGDRVEVVVNPNYSYFLIIKNIEKIEDDSDIKIRGY